MKNFYKNGGNLLLTSQAGLLLSQDAFGRINKNSEAVFYEPRNLGDAKIWGINAYVECADHRNHPIYKNMMQQFVERSLMDGDYAHPQSLESKGYDIYPLLIGRGGGAEYANLTGFSPSSENHNFYFENDHDGSQRYSGYELQSQENCTVLGQWGQDRNLENYIPNIVEVHPTALFAGRAITIGFGAYDWCVYQDNGTIFPNEGSLVINNADNNSEKTYINCQANIKQLTKNALNYLVGSDKMKVNFKPKFDNYTTSFYSDRDLVLPDRVTGYIYKEVKKKEADKYYSETECMEIESGQVVPAGTAVVLHTNLYNETEGTNDSNTRTFSTISNYGDANNTYVRRTGATPNVIDKVYGDDNNILCGHDIETTITDSGDDRIWVLGTGNRGVAFYWATPSGYVTSTNTLTCPAHRSYLKASPEVAASSIRLPYFYDAFDDNTAIDTVIKDNTKTNTEGCYTLQGIKVDNDNLKPGIYIKNGKKFIIK